MILNHGQKRCQMSTSVYAKRMFAHLNLLWCVWKTDAVRRPNMELGLRVLAFVHVMYILFNLHKMKKNPTYIHLYIGWFKKNVPNFKG
jgi:hypothetical protein